LSHPLRPLPWALANDGGSLRNTNKAALARELEKNVSPAEEIPEPSATIINGKSLVQKLKGNDQTFWQLAESALSHVFHDGSLRKTNKAPLARELEKNVSPAEEIPEPSAAIIDGMSLVQKLKGNDQTFWQLAESALSHVLHEGPRAIA